MKRADVLKDDGKIRNFKKISKRNYFYINVISINKYYQPLKKSSKLKSILEASFLIRQFIFQIVYISKY